MRPIFFGATIDPPVMDVLIPSLDGQLRIVRGVRIRTPVVSIEEAKRAAVREVRAFTPSEIELLREVSVPVSRAELVAGETPLVEIEIVEQLPRYAGNIFCPLCCRKLGRGDSPAIGYLAACPGCHVAIVVESTDTAVRVTLRIVPE